MESGQRAAYLSGHHTN